MAWTKGDFMNRLRCSHALYLTAWLAFSLAGGAQLAFAWEISSADISVSSGWSPIDVWNGTPCGAPSNQFTVTYPVLSSGQLGNNFTVGGTAPSVIDASKRWEGPSNQPTTYPVYEIDEIIQPNSPFKMEWRAWGRPD